MADSNDFFSIRHGSAGCLTFQERHGKQVTKMRVYEVRNPKTLQQAQQRFRMATATKFMSRLSPVLKKFFETIPHDTRSLNRFLALNAGEESLRPYENPFIGVAKNSYGFWPNHYQISEGSLTSNAAILDGAIIKPTMWATGAISTINFLARNTAISSGDIMTIVAIFNLKDSTITETTDNNQNVVLADTIVISNSAITDYEHANTANDQFQVNLKTCEITCIDPGITTTPLAAAVINYRAATTTAAAKNSPERLSLAPILPADRNAINQAALQTYLPKAKVYRGTRYLNGG